MRYSFLKASLCAAVILACPGTVAAQAARLDTSDVDLFYRLYDATGGRPSAEQIQSRYIDVGSPGLRTFFQARRTTATRVAEALAAQPALYERARACASVLPRVKTRVDAALAKLVALYPQARLPTVTIAVGRGRPVAIGSPVDGVQVGLEALCGADFIEPNIEDRFVGILVHEYVHAQQDAALVDKQKPTVLEAALMEGGAEFVTELLTGRPAYGYFAPLTKGREREIETAFSLDLDKADLSAWFYNSTPEKPGDLGYWVGYRITRGYYEHAPDKALALRQILTVTDVHAFLDASGWRPGRPAASAPSSP